MKEQIHISGIPPNKKSIQMLDHVEKTIGRGSYVGLFGITLKDGKGCYVEDVDGNVYLDCLTAASTNILGYKRGKIANAYFDAVQQNQHTCFLYSPNIYAVRLAEKLIEITPGVFPRKVMFGVSGSDACGGAIKAMRKYTKKLGLIHFKNDYHGSTGLSEQASKFSHLNDGIYPESKYFIELPFPQTREESEKVLKEIAWILQEKPVGGVIGEAIQGDAGIQLPYEYFYKQLRAVTQDHDALLIIDEVQSGMGRTGKWWAIEHEEVIPDMIVTAKGLSGGYAAISAVIGREEVIDSLHPGQHLFTYSGHAPACAAAYQTIEVIESESLIDDTAHYGVIFKEGLKKIRNDFPEIIVDVRGKGFMLGVEIALSHDPLAAKVFATRCVEKGLYVGFFGVKAEVVRIEPPLYFKQKEVDIALNIIESVAQEMTQGNIPAITYENVKKYSIGISASTDI